tara:strand:- start:860 stop:1048 length:189 start_codon:yes stop_codon:yes gene_type:complete
MAFKAGDILKSTESNHVFECVDIIEKGELIGWPICKNGGKHNPKFLRKYNGAISVLNLSIKE